VDGGGGDAELVSDLFGAQASEHEAEAFPLAFRQGGEGCAVFPEFHTAKLASVTRRRPRAPRRIMRNCNFEMWKIFERSL